MQYALLLKPLANEHAYQAEKKWALEELRCLLFAFGIQDSDAHYGIIGANEFLVFSLKEARPEILMKVSMHSSACLFCEITQGETLRPLPPYRNQGLPMELPHILKYKGKTNVDFTRMMLHCAWALSAYPMENSLRLLDPMCGKATTLFCGAAYGMKTWGMDVSKKKLQEADGYLERFLQMHRWKYQRNVKSFTLKKGFVRATEYISGKNAAELKTAPNQLTMMEADLRTAPELFREPSFHLIVSDLPYGAQHAPHENNRLSTLADLAASLAEISYRCLKAGGTLAFSYNENTLKTNVFRGLLKECGFRILNENYQLDFSHWMEQGIVRDVVIARKDQ